MAMLRIDRWVASYGMLFSAHAIISATCSRSGVASILNEFAQAARACCLIEEDSLPLKLEARGISEILGLDQLYLANEGLIVAVIDATQSYIALATLRALPSGEVATTIGSVRADPADTLVMTSLFGGERLVDMLEGVQLPRIC